MDSQWFILIIAVWTVIGFIYKREGRKRRLLPLAEVLDDRRFEMEGIFNDTMSGLFQGQPTRFSYNIGGQVMFPSRIRPEFHVAISCRKAFPFVLSWDATREPFTDWVGPPEVKEKVASLLLAEKMNFVRLVDGFLRVCYVGDEVEDKMQPPNVRPVLEELQALAKSLESV